MTGGILLNTASMDATDAAGTAPWTRFGHA
jgi:hypothetical protein